ncbi:hypothetical protein L1049_011135 [Liquidambar formosana]|uniref:Secreted protein n=1 Tax=Liquidambar formosana TaxID=63359 RepID=A0AAP0X2G0_LIQFO
MKWENMSLMPSAVSSFLWMVFLVVCSREEAAAATAAAAGGVEDKNRDASVGGRAMGTQTHVRRELVDFLRCAGKCDKCVGSSH